MAVGGWVRQWDLGDLADPLLLILSELVTNAVVGAGSPVDITLSADRQAVRLSVGDRDQRRPGRPGEPGGLAPGSPLAAERGRGLLIVDRLADEWGVASLPSGKVVWAVLAPPASWRPRPRQYPSYPRAAHSS